MAKQIKTDDYDRNNRIIIGAFINACMKVTDEYKNIHPNQIETAYEIVNNIIDTKCNIINQMIIGKTQSEKTGTMLSIIYEYYKFDYKEYTYHSLINLIIKDILILLCLFLLKKYIL